MLAVPNKNELPTMQKVLTSVKDTVKLTKSIFYIAMKVFLVY